MALLLSPATLNRLTTLPSQKLLTWCAQRDMNHARKARRLPADTLQGSALKTATTAQSWTQKGLYVAAFAPAKSLARLPLPFSVLMQWPILSRMVGTFTVSQMLQRGARDFAAQANHAPRAGALYQVGALACMAAAMLFTEIPTCVFVVAERSVLEMGYFAGYAVGTATHMLRDLHAHHEPRTAPQG